MDIQDTPVSATIKGNEPAVAEIGQQLAWLGSSLRSSFSDSICYCTPTIVSPRDADTHFRLTFELQDIKPGDHKVDQNGSCWLPLFRNPVIVKGYPILARMQGERGLEVPLNMTAGIGEASRVTDFDGGFLMKGFCILFCPMKRVKDSVTMALSFPTRWEPNPISGSGRMLSPTGLGMVSTPRVCRFLGTSLAGLLRWIVSEVRCRMFTYSSHN